MRAPILCSDGTHGGHAPSVIHALYPFRARAKFPQLRTNSIPGKIDPAIRQRRKRESKSTGRTTLHGTGAVGPFLCFELGDHFGECHALSGIALPTSLDHLPHAIRELRVIRPVRQATIQHRIHSRDDVPVGVRGFPTKNLKGALPFNSVIRGCELYSYLPGYSGKGK